MMKELIVLLVEDDTRQNKDVLDYLSKKIYTDKIFSENIQLF